jgi:hypothetical protein
MYAAVVVADTDLNHSLIAEVLTCTCKVDLVVCSPQRCDSHWLLRCHILSSVNLDSLCSVIGCAMSKEVFNGIFACGEGRFPTAGEACLLMQLCHTAMSKNLDRTDVLVELVILNSLLCDRIERKLSLHERCFPSVEITKTIDFCLALFLP